MRKPSTQCAGKTAPPIVLAPPPDAVETAITLNHEPLWLPRLTGSVWSASLIVGLFFDLEEMRIEGEEEKGKGELKEDRREHEQKKEEGNKNGDQNNNTNSGGF